METRPARKITRTISLFIQGWLDDSSARAASPSIAAVPSPMDASVTEQSTSQSTQIPPVASLTPVDSGAYMSSGLNYNRTKTFICPTAPHNAAVAATAVLQTATTPSSLRESPASKEHIPPSSFVLRAGTPPTERPKSPAFSGLGKSPDGIVYATPDVRLHHRAVLVAAGDDATGMLGGLVRQLSIDQFENEGRRVSIGTPGGDMSARRTTPINNDRASTVAGIHKTVLAVLLRPREWRPQADR